MKVLVIIPAYNEEKNITQVVDNLKSICPSYDYIVINDESKDNTLQVLQNNKYNYLNMPINLGIGGVIQCGYQYAWENVYDIAIQLDGDGQHDPRYLCKAVSLIEEGKADIVIGSRFISKEGFQSSFMRRFGIKFLSTLIKVVCGANVKDVTSGYRIVNRKFIGVYAREYAQDYPEPEAIVAAKMYKARIKEIPVVMSERAEGESSISAMDSVIYMVKVSLAIIFYRFSFKFR